ncbi:MAG: Fluoroquinolones export permease protein [Syntrophomonadaceae bacterium]|nr:Fluoroquinolones export permease protein [Bacillota bacterium]
MTNLKTLIRGEFGRLNKYGLFKANFVVLLLWVFLAWFLEGEALLQFIPFIFLMDSVMMTILLVGATLFYEKKEHTVNSLMVTPVTENEYLLSKVITNVLNSLLTVFIISLVVYLLKGVTYTYWQVVPAVALVTVVHTLIGIRLSYGAKDFTSLLVNYMVYVFIFFLPPVFGQFGLFDRSVARFFILLPPEASGLLIGSAFAAIEPWKIVFSYVYLALLSLLLFRFVVKPQFMAYVMRETGV